LGSNQKETPCFLGPETVSPARKIFRLRRLSQRLRVNHQAGSSKTCPPSPLDTALVLALTVPVFTVRSTFGSGIPKVVAVKYFSDFLL